MRKLLILILCLAGLLAACNPSPKTAVQTAEETYTPDQSTPEPSPPELPAYTEISPRSQNRRIPVIMYHDVISERKRSSQWFDCSVAEFEEQMQFLQEKGAVPISIKDLYEHLTMGKEVPETAVVLTFDDNYQGFYDNAWPILKRLNFPAAMFVHTGFVGSTTGEHPKMSWETLAELVKDPLFTVGGHTISHPDDISKLPYEEQEKELRDSKAELESKLGITVDFLAYPNGKNDEVTQSISRANGYKMAFSIVNGLAEESPGIMCVSRYVHTRLAKALEDRDRAVLGAPGIAQGALVDAPLTLQIEEIEDVKLALIRGGKPESVVSDTRESVGEFVTRTGAQAGINGTFFSMAAIASTDNRLVGPCKAHDQTAVIGDEERTRWPKLVNRPVLMWGPTGIAVVPFQPETMRTDEAFRAFMPDLTDVFMGGAWLVHDGMPLSREAMSTFGSRDIQDARRRAFVGWDNEGKFVVGATRESASSEKVAVALAAAGVKEAILMDSGFSTSLVYGTQVLASGHSTASKASRPVPHAVVLRGEMDPASAKLAQENSLKQPTEEPRRRRRRRS